MKHLLVVVLFLAGCSLSPEAQLLKGYQSASASVKAATVLTNRDALSVEDAERAFTLGTTAKAALDAGKERLKVCRATKADCSNAALTIDLGANVLMDLENYLKAQQ